MNFDGLECPFLTSGLPGADLGVVALGYLGFGVGLRDDPAVDGSLVVHYWQVTTRPANGVLTS